MIELIPHWVKRAARERHCMPMVFTNDPLVELTMSPLEAAAPTVTKRVSRGAYDLDPDRYWRDVLEEWGQRSQVH